MNYQDVFGDMPEEESAKYIIGVIGFYFRSQQLEEIAKHLGMNQKIDFSNQIRYEANDLRTCVVTAFDPRLENFCIGTLEKAIQVLPEEYHWLSEVIGSYPTHYAREHLDELNISQLNMLYSVPDYPLSLTK